MTDNDRGHPRRVQDYEAAAREFLAHERIDGITHAEEVFWFTDIADAWCLTSEVDRRWLRQAIRELRAEG